MRQVTYLSNPVLLSYLVDSSALADITELIFLYPWNSALHLTVIDIYRDIFDNCEDGEIKVSALQSSNLLSKILGAFTSESESSSKEFKFKSERKMRHGHMALLVRLA